MALCCRAWCGGLTACMPSKWICYGSSKSWPRTHCNFDRCGRQICRLRLKQVLPRWDLACILVLCVSAMPPNKALCLDASATCLVHKAQHACSCARCLKHTSEPYHVALNSIIIQPLYLLKENASPQTHRLMCDCRSPVSLGKSGGR